MFTKILLATDGSAHAAKAAETAGDMAVKYGVGLTIVTALQTSLSLDQLQNMPEAERFPDGVKEEIKRYLEALTNASTPDSLPGFIELPAPPGAIQALGDIIVEAAASIAMKPGLDSAQIERLVISGHPAKVIVETAEKTEADLIVLGTRGLSDLRGTLLGSVSHKVVNLADCPCLLVK